MTFFPAHESIDLTHYPQQLEMLLQKNQDRLQQLITQQEPWTWDNLMHPLEDMDDVLERSWSPIAHLHAVMNSPELRACYDACLPKLSAYESALHHNHALYLAIKSINHASLNSTQQKIIIDRIQDFELSGVSLPEADKKRLEVIDARLSDLSNQFETNLLDAEQHDEQHITDEKRLTGIPEHAKQTARAHAQEKQQPGFLFSLSYPNYHAIITYADDRMLRQNIHYAYNTRASDIGSNGGLFDNTAVIKEILSLRQEKALLLGFPHYAAYSLTTKMAQSTTDVIDFLMDLRQRAHSQAELEWQALQQFAKAHHQLDTLEPWDIAYITQKKKQAEYAITDETLRPYFPLTHVMTGLFDIIHRLYGISFKEVSAHESHPWHPDVRCYALFDETKTTRGYLYVDLFARANKRNGAWMDSLQSRRILADGSVQLPVATLTCNFATPSPNHPATLSHDEVETLLHECGHCLHHLLTQVDYQSASGIHGVEWDAVELPSQFFENWCWAWEPLELLSSHIETHTTLPRALFDQLIASKQFQSALALLRQVQFALLDIELHETTELHTDDPITPILERIRKLTSIIPTAPYQRFLHSFSHIFAGGYAAGYYSYLWAEVLSCDAFTRFQTEGIFNTTTGHDFLRCILEVGGSLPAAEAYQHFQGRPPRIDALLKHHGIS